MQVMPRDIILKHVIWSWPFNIKIRGLVNCIIKADNCQINQFSTFGHHESNSSPSSFRCCSLSCATKRKFVIFQNSKVLLRHQILKRQLSRQMFFWKLLIFSSLYLLSNLKYISNKCFQDKMSIKMPKWCFWETIFGIWKHQCYVLCFHYWDLSDEHLMW